MFKFFFCEMGKNVIHWVGAWGNGGTFQIASWKCNFSIYLDIQAITTLLWLLLVLYVLVPSIDSFIQFIRSPEKWHFQALKNLLLPVFNIQASDWVHCLEETGAYYQLSWLTNKFFFFKLLILQKNVLFKKFPKIYCSFFSKKR